MEVVKLLVVFLVIVFILKLKKPLPLAIAGGAFTASLLYRLGTVDTLIIVFDSLKSEYTIAILLTFYLITFLQRMLEKRGDLALAQKSLNGLFNNRRINASLAPIFIGLLPSAGAVTICGAIVDTDCADYLTREEKTLVTSYFRHIPESFLPTYSSIILGVQLSGVALSSYLMGMLPMVAVLIGLGYFFCLRKLPTDTGQPPSVDRKKDLINLLLSLWTIASIIILIIFFKVTVNRAVLGIIFLNIFVNKFTRTEIMPMFWSAFESRLLLSTAVIMVFKDIISSTKVIEVLPDIFSKLPIPIFLVFFLIFFFGTVISGQMAITAICLPLAFATIPDAGMPLLVLLLGTGYIAMQVSPTHICLAVVTEYFNTNMGTLIRMTLPIVLSFSILLIAYYLLLIQFIY